MPRIRAKGPAWWRGLSWLAVGSASSCAAVATLPKDNGGNVVVVVRRVEKIHVTTVTTSTTARLRVLKRIGSLTCPTNYALCPATLSGGCCPSHYGCETDSCVQTTVSTASACSLQGYTACGIDAGGGCCPFGYVCGVNACTAPVGVAQTEQCPTGYYLCPASYNYGCCATTMGCALNACYATVPSTVVFTATFTTATDRAGRAEVTTVTSTTVESPTPPSGLPTSDTAAYVAKFLPSVQAKASEIPAVGNGTATSSSSRGGLTKAQIGGMIGGLVGLLLIVLTAAFFIVRSIRRSAKVVKVKGRKALSTGGSGSGKGTGTGLYAGGSGGGGGDGGGGTGSSGSAARYSGQNMKQVHLPTPSQIGQMEYDDLLLDTRPAQTPADGSTTTPAAASGSTPYDARHSSNTTTTTSPPAVLPSGHGRGPSDTSLLSSDAEGGGRGVDARGYFELPLRTPSRAERPSLSGTDPRTSYDSRAAQNPHPNHPNPQYHRPRVTSDTSDASNNTTAAAAAAAGVSPGVGSPLQPAELGTDGELIPELPSESPMYDETLPTASTAAGTYQQTHHRQSHYQPGQSVRPSRPRHLSYVSAISDVSQLSPGLQQQQQQQQQQPPSAPGHARDRSDSNGSSSSAAAFLQFSHSRSRSGSGTSLQLGPQQPQQQQQQQQQQPLGAVSEAAELLHGHYGPNNVAAGETHTGGADGGRRSPAAP